MTKAKRAKVQQSIENKRENIRIERRDTVRFTDKARDSLRFVGKIDRVCPIDWLYLDPLGHAEAAMRALSLSRTMTGLAIFRGARRRCHGKSLSHQEKFSAEMPLARSASPMFGAHIIASGLKAAFTPSNKYIEQRCCIAA